MKRLFLYSLILVCLTSTLVLAQSKRPVRDRLKVKEIDTQQAEAVLNKFRNQRIQGDFSFNFELHHLPRRGQAVHYYGRLWGSSNELGPITRVQLLIGNGLNPTANSIDILLQSGSQQNAWLLNENGEPHKLTETELLNPLLPDVLYTPFHLLMPFIYWSNWEYAGAQRIKGRPAHLFLMSPPESYAQTKLDIKGVRMALDEKFNALLEADILGSDGREIKSFRILNVKKVQGQWIPRSIDLIDSAKRNKTRFEISAAALNLNLPTSVFSLEGMGSAPPELTAEQFDYFH